MSRVPSIGAPEQRFRNFTLGLLLALVVVICLDLVVRVTEARLSGDVASKERFGVIMRQTESTSDKPLFVAVGSSLVDRGFDVDVLADAVAAQTGSPVVVKLAPDNSTIWDWTCVVEQHVLGREPAARLVIIGFAWDQLSDRAPLILRRNFNNLCPPSKLGEFSTYSSNVHIETWLNMAAVITSKLYTHREPIRDRLFSRLIPNFQEVSQQINERDNAREATAKVGIESPSASSGYGAAGALLQRLGERGTRAVLVAMPVQKPYQIDRGICDILGSRHEFLDMRTSVPADPELYRDPIHLNEEGARRFSAVLASQLSANVARKTPCAS